MGLCSMKTLSQHCCIIYGLCNVESSQDPPGDSAGGAYVGVNACCMCRTLPAWLHRHDSLSCACRAVLGLAGGTAPEE